MPELRTRSAGANVTEKEYAEIEKLAESRGLNVGEWCRETLLARVNSQEPRAATDCAGTGQYRRSVTETRLYSPEYLEEVFGWAAHQDEWVGILCEIEPPARVDVEMFMRPLCLKWRSDSEEALLKKARGIKSLWADAIKQIPDGEMGFIYVAYPEGSRAAATKLLQQMPNGTRRAGGQLV
jgi:hypothetical protein